MVSATLLTGALALFFMGQAVEPAQGPSASAFRPDSKQDGLLKPPAQINDGAITPEMRGDIYMARKMYREAIDSYKSAPESAVTINKTGIAYHHMLDLNLARKYYEKAAKVDRKYSEAMNNLGTVFYAQKSYRRAINQYQKALRFSPDSASIWSNLGTAQFARKKYEEAMKCYQKAMSLDPDVFERKGTTGVLLQERSVQERAKFHYYQAKLYAKQGQTDRALLYLRKALEEGLKERDKIKNEPDFESIREMKEFQELIETQQRVL
ncbi:MAG: tetratricopeptide repeat protein [Acidobacteria bacterium]|nr:tetratricopeptide repeat protein [Acidobacteriota bacterium]